MNEYKSQEGFPKLRFIRKQELQKIKNTKEISTMKIPGVKTGPQKVYRIPLEFLSYNPYNTRFIAEAKTLEKEYGVLNDENPEHVKLIEEFLWDYKKDKNEYTITSLIKEGQLEPGVVTPDGVIIAGNRRFRLLNEIQRNRSEYDKPGVNLEGLQYFEAVILDNNLSPKEIIQYESFYQYGTDEKVDYNPIEKYIAAHDQMKRGFSIKEIYDNFRAITENEKEILIRLDVYKLMQDYLSYIGEPDVYTALNEKEEAFLNINKNLSPLQKGVGRSKGMWAFNPDIDIPNFKMVAFNYIRNGLGTHEFRSLFEVFKNEERWKDFFKKFKEEIKNGSVNSLEEYKEKYKKEGTMEVSEIRKRDFMEMHKKGLDRLFNIEKAFQINQENKEMPIDVLNKSLNGLIKFKEIISENKLTDEVREQALELLLKIQEKSGQLKQNID